jgi:hypothetical protein
MILLINSSKKFTKFPLRVAKSSAVEGESHDQADDARKYYY